MSPRFFSFGTSRLELGLRTFVMGVINTTPDSFSDGGKHYNLDAAIAAGLRMLDEGADIIDVGGESTRPGSLPVEPEEEHRRAIPVIKAIAAERPHAAISIDTRRRTIAEAAIAAGAGIINDVTGFRDDPSMIEFAREASTGLVVMHMLGRPRTMQQQIHYDSFPGDIVDFFRERIRTFHDAGIDSDRIVIDPGIGFGKTFDQNLTLVNRLDVFKPLGKPILVGPSRKAFIGKILNVPDASERDPGTMAVVAAAVMRGAAFVRVHDAASAVATCRIVDAVLREKVEL